MLGPLAGVNGGGGGHAGRGWNTPIQYVFQGSLLSSHHVNDNKT